MIDFFVWRQVGDKIDTRISWPWKHFFASKIVLRVIVCCLRGVGSMSSSSRILRFIVLFCSGHRWLFVLASLWAYVVIASFLCLRVVGSSFRLYLHIKVIPSLFCLLPCCSATLLPCYLVTLLSCYHVTLLPCNLVTPLPCYYVTLLLCNFVTLLLLYGLYLHKLYLPFFPWYLVPLLPCYLVTLSCC